MKNYAPFIIILMTRLFAQLFLVLVIYRFGFFGTSLNTAEPLPAVNMKFLIFVYITSFMTGFHQFELQVRFVCIGSPFNPCTILGDKVGL